MVYIKKDTLVAYIHEEDVSCEYLEVNEIVGSTQGIKDHNVSAETKQQFEELKAKYPEVFSLNNEDIGQTQLVTMDIDTGDSPPVC